MDSWEGVKTMVLVASSLARQTMPTIQTMEARPGLPLPSQSQTPGQPAIFTKYTIFQPASYLPTLKNEARSIWGSTLSVGGHIDRKV